jgi:hypothetical protein
MVKKQDITSSAAHQSSAHIGLKKMIYVTTRLRMWLFKLKPLQGFDGISALEA